jgi:signal transduction histidine kinase/CheY-like chemotaxis protein
MPPGDAFFPHFTPNELKDLSLEFNQLCRAVKDNEARLAESDARIRSLFDRVEHGVFRLDRDGVIIEANSRFKSLFGDVNKLCDILAAHPSAPDCLQRLADRTVLHLEDRAIGRSGNELMVSLSLYPTKDSAGAVVGFDGYIIDVTEKKHLEERLIRAQKMEAVGTLAGGMAHDFNNLLTAILGYSGIMLKSIKEGDALYKPTSIIHNAAKRGAEFGKKILTLTRKEKMEIKPVNINDIVKSSLELLQRSIPKNIEITTHLADEIPFTNADPSQIQQVIINLAVNARDAMPDGGKLLIETAVIGGDGGPVGAGKREKGGFIRLSISDTGVGINEEMQARIFDPFFTTKDVGKGTGLGLYMVQSIITNHGGYINLYSEPSQGTRFSIYLPVTKGMPRELASASSDLRGTGTILIIDDEADVRELCKDILCPLGYSVLLAEGGQAGVKLYRDHKDVVSLVILDMIMPKLGGIEAFNALRIINPSVKILLYSGYSHNNFSGIAELLKQGAIGFIQKPFSSLDIALAVKKAVSPVLLQNSL